MYIYMYVQCPLRKCLCAGSFTVTTALVCVLNFLAALRSNKQTGSLHLRHLITAHYSYAFSNSRESLQCCGFTNKQTNKHLGRIPFPFLLSPLPRLLQVLLICLLSSPIFLFLLPSSPLCPRPFTLFLFTFDKSPSVPCRFLSHIACQSVSLCRCLIPVPTP